MKPSYSPFLMATTLFFFVFALGAWFFVIPSYAKLIQDNKSIAGYTPPVVKQDTSETTQQQAFAATKTAADTLLPSDSQEYDLSVQVEALCKNIGVTIGDMSFTAPDSLPKTTGIVATTAGTTPTLTLSLTVTGTYSQVQQVTDGLVSLSRFIQVTQLTLSVPQASGSPGSDSAVTAVLDAQAFYLPGATASPTPTPTP